MATFYSGSSRGYQLRLELWEAWTDASANTSGVRSQLFLSNTTNTFSWRSNGSHNISGVVGWSISNVTINMLSRYSTILLSDFTITVGHDAFGRGSASAFGDFTNNYTGNAYNCPYLAVSGSIGLTDFNRSPSQPAWVRARLLPGNTIEVEAASASSPAGTPTYWVSFSSNNGLTWSSESRMDSARKIQYSTLTKGQTYIFRVRLQNIDGYSGFTTSSPIFLPSGGKRFDGTNFVPTAIARRFDTNTSSWIDLSTAKRFDASINQWVDLS